ncbi:MAG: amino acid--tRNA ligase-related protein, partial [Pseudomonadota bacterium]
MKRILTSETAKNIGKKVKVAGWANTRRDHGGIVFLDLRDRSGSLQVVADPNLVKEVKEECVLEIEGEVKRRPEKMVNPKIKTGEIEIRAEKIDVLSKSAILPFELRDLNLSLPKLLDYRPLTLRNQKIKAIFKIQAQIVESFRKVLKSLDFTEFQSPNIVPAVAEGGAEIFHVDYYKYDAYLAQSPQLYKQIMLGAFERVFTVTHVYRAEPSVTTRHLSEYTSLDVEMGFIDSWQELMDTCQMLVKNIISDVQKNCQEELKTLEVVAPEAGGKIPR